MNITTNTRHGTLPAAVRRRAETRMLRLRRYEPRLLAADIEFDVDRGLHRVEARLTVAGGPVVVAHGGERDLRVALDRTAERLRRQLESRRGRRRRHQAGRLADRLAPAGGG